MQNAFTHGTAEQTYAVELFAKGFHESGAVAFDSIDHLIENGLIDAIRVVGGFEQEWRDGRDEHDLRNPRTVMPAHVARDFAAAHRETNERDIVEIETVEHRFEIVGQRVVIVSAPRLRRSTEAAARVSDRPQTALGQGERLTFPHFVTDRPAVDEHDGLAGAPVLIGEFDRLIGGIRASFDEVHFLESV